MATYNSAQEYANAQKLLLTRIKLYEVPFELAVRSVLAIQTQRIFDKGINSSGGTIGQYQPAGPDTGLYINPKTVSPRAVPGYDKAKVQGLLPTRGKPSTEWVNPTNEYPEGEHIFTESTYYRGAPGTKPGDAHRTTYVKSYKDYRNRIGRRIDRVDLNLTGDMLLDFATSRTKGRAITEGNGSLLFTVEFKRQANAAKRENAEDKYGRIFALTEFEKKEYFKTLAYELRRAAEDLRK